MPTTFDGVKDGSTLVPCKDATARNDISTINGKIPSAASSSNKLVDTSAMNTAIGNAVSAAYKPAGTKTAAELVSGLLVAANKGNVYNITTAGTTTADFLEGAGKPIRVGDNVGICEPTSGTFKFDLLSGFVAVDENPTAGSANPVSSGGVKTALDGKVDKVTGKGLSKNDYTDDDKAVVTTAQDNIKANTKLISESIWGEHGKNMLPVTLYGNWTSNGITVTKKAKNVLHFEGTSTAGGCSFAIDTVNGNSVDRFNAGKYKRSCVITGTTDGSAPTFTCTLHNADGTTKVTDFQAIAANDTERVRTMEITGTDYVGQNRIWIPAGRTVNCDVKIMIVDFDVLDMSYEPYREAIEKVFRYEQKLLGAKNFLPFPYSTSDGTFHGITCTTNDDGTITFDGLNDATTAWAYVVLSDITGTKFKSMLKNKDCILSGGVNNPSIISKVYIRAVEVGNWGNVKADDTGNGIVIPISWINDNSTYRIDILIVPGAPDLDNVVFKPMIRLASDTDDTYVPYAMTNKELMDKMFPRSEQAVLGAKNLLPIMAKTQTTNGVTFTVNSDGTITVNGTASGGNAIFYFSYWSKTNMIKKFSPNRKYILSGCPAGGTLWESYQLDLFLTESTTFVDIGNEVEIDGQYLANITYDTAYFRIRIANGTTVNNMVFKPMVRLASDSDDTFVPHAKTNKELTEVLYFEDGTTGIKALRSGNIVSVFFEETNPITAEADTTIIQLPNSFRPSVSSLSFVEPLNKYRVIISTDGSIICKTALSNASIRGYVTFVTENVYL